MMSTVALKRVSLLVFAATAVLLLLATGVSAEEQTWVLEEVENPSMGAAPLCDDVQQYAGYFKLTTGVRRQFVWATTSRGKCPSLLTCITPTPPYIATPHPAPPGQELFLLVLREPERPGH